MVINPALVFVFVVFTLVLHIVLFVLLRVFSKKEKPKKTVDKAQQATFQAAINSVHVGFIMTDVNGEILNINLAAKEILYLKKHVNLNYTQIDPGLVKMVCTMSDLETRLA